MSLTDNFDKRHKSKAAKAVAQNSNTGSEIETYPTIGNARNVDFVQLDGEAEFFNYAYITTCKIEADASMITLEFSTGHKAILKGRNLKALYDQLFVQLPKRITTFDKRYLSLKGDAEPVVIDISITKTDL